MLVDGDVEVWIVEYFVECGGEDILVFGDVFVGGVGVDLGVVVVVGVEFGLWLLVFDELIYNDEFGIGM